MAGALFLIVVGLLCWVFIFIFFTKRADRDVEKFDRELRKNLKKLSEEINFTLSQTIKESSAKLETAEKEMLSKLDEARKRIESSENKLTEFLLKIEVREALRKELKELPLQSYPTQPIIIEYYGEFPKKPIRKKMPYETLPH
jgi:ElaB/YqjD/DUF883 family membrane-anchored ribosome-binding protein